MDEKTRALVDVATQWLAAFNGRDLDALLALYEDDAVHTSPKLRDREPETKGEIRGTAALRAWWEGAMTRLPKLRYEPTHLTAMTDHASTAGRVFMEYVRTNPGDADLLVAEVLVVGASGRICCSRVYHG